MSGSENNYDFLTITLAYRLLTREQVSEAQSRMVDEKKLSGKMPLPEVFLRENGYLTEEQVWAVGKARARLLRDQESGAHKIGNYEILETIGEGGLGVVYKAKQISVGRIVALKVLHEKWMSDTEFRRRFLIEARLVGRLTHPNLIQIIDIGRHHNQLFYSMEFVEGDTVEKLIFRRGRLDISESLAIVTQIATALQYLAEKKIVHRDIKPSNIIVTKKGVAKLGDFGFVKSSLDSVLSSVGEVLGTPDYISPEAAGGEKNLDFRSDIYSLGVTFYHMLAGQAPFNGSCSAVLDAHITQSLPPLDAIDPDIPPAVSKMINRLTAKKPENRHQTYAELLLDLEKIRARYAPRVPNFGDSELWRLYRRYRRWMLFAEFVSVLLLAAIVYIIIKN